MKRLSWAATAAAFFVSQAAMANDLAFSAWLTDGAVLQRGATLSVSGTAPPGSAVELNLGGSQSSAIADRDGEWRADIPAPVKAEGLSLTATAGSQTVSVTDLALGEVFLCSGQSNMQFPMSKAALPDDKRTSKLDSRIRVLAVPRAKAQVEQAAFATPARWEGAERGGADFSAVCLLMARDLARDHKGTIGLVEADWGGTPIEGWLPRSALAATGAEPAALDMLDAYRRDPVKAAAQFDDSVAKDWASKPRVVYASLYNAMVAPLAGARFAGGVWYQGENNAGNGTPRAKYVRQLAALTATWRDQFGPSLPVVIIQIAPFGKISDAPAASASAEIREAQREFVVSDPRAALVPTIDIGERLDIHPPLKLPVAQRAANAFRHLIDGAPSSFLGPRVTGASATGGFVRVRTVDAEGGLMAASWGRPGPLQLCDASGACVFADGRIDGDALVVEALAGRPTAVVRYCWGAAPICNVFDRAGRPLAPFELPVAPQ